MTGPEDAEEAPYPPREPPPPLNWATAGLAQKHAIITANNEHATQLENCFRMMFNLLESWFASRIKAIPLF